MEQQTEHNTNLDEAFNGAKAMASAAKAGATPESSREDTFTKQIESVTTKVPSSTFLGLALGSIAVSALLQGLGRKSDAQFVGQWVPTILILGVYNKIVKLHGSE